jgi:hypothetical protein
MRELQSCKTNEQLERAAQNASALALTAASPTRAPSATATTATTAATTGATGAATGAAGTGAAATGGAGVSEDSLRYSSSGSSQYMSQPTQGSFRARYLGDYSGQQLSSLRGASLVTSGMHVSIPVTSHKLHCISYIEVSAKGCGCDSDQCMRTPAAVQRSSVYS